MAALYNDTSRLGYNFRELLGLFQRADFTLKIEKDPIGGDNQRDIRFNFFSNREKYKSSLAQTYRQMCEEMEVDIAEKYEKVRKLDFITRHIAEIEMTEGMLTKNTAGLLDHLNFEFTNVSDDPTFQAEILTVLEAQKYLRLMELFIFKCKRYLSGLAENIRITPQADFPLPKSMLPDPNDATNTNPVAYFEYLVYKNGLAKLKNDFIPTEDEYDGYEHVSYNQNTEVKTIAEMDPETGDWEEREIKFSDLLLNKLYSEFYKSRNLIDDHINELKTDIEISFFLKLTLQKLRYILGVIPKTKSLDKYPDVPKPIRSLILFCYEKYGVFCPEPDKIIEDTLQHATLYQVKQDVKLLETSTINPGVFTWKKENSARLTTILHTGLNENFIEKIELTEFAKAFDGGSPERPLGIRWIDKPRSNATVNKVTLLYLFKKLSEAGLIDSWPGTEILQRKLEYVFTDGKGNKLQNWAQSVKNIQVSKTVTHRKKEIDTLVRRMAGNNGVLS